jgi:hypothetical protein
LESIYRLNEYFAYGKLLELKQEPLVFDGVSWLKLEKHDLALPALAVKKCFETNKTIRSAYRDELYGIIMGFNGYYFQYQRAKLGSWDNKIEFEPRP